MPSRLRRALHLSRHQLRHRSFLSIRVCAITQSVCSSHHLCVSEFVDDTWLVPGQCLCPLCHDSFVIFDIVMEQCHCPLCQKPTTPVFVFLTMTLFERFPLSKLARTVYLTLHHGLYKEQNYRSKYSLLTLSFAHRSSIQLQTLSRHLRPKSKHRKHSHRITFKLTHQAQLPAKHLENLISTGNNNNNNNS